MTVNLSTHHALVHRPEFKVQHCSAEIIILDLKEKEKQVMGTYSKTRSLPPSLPQGGRGGLGLGLGGRVLDYLRREAHAPLDHNFSLP